MAYEDFKDLARRTASDKLLCDKPFNIAKILKYDGYQRVLASMVYKFFDKEASVSGVENENISNNELAEKLHKNLRRENYNPLLFAIFGVMILLICN